MPWRTREEPQASVVWMCHAHASALTEKTGNDGTVAAISPV